VKSDYFDIVYLPYVSYFNVPLNILYFVVGAELSFICMYACTSNMFRTARFSKTSKSIEIASGNN